MSTINKFSINFTLESRKNKDTGELESENVPINMDITYAGKRVRYYTGYRVERENWIDFQDDTKIQRVKRNTINKAGASASVVNAHLTKLSVIVNDIFNEYGKSLPTQEELRKGIIGKLEIVITEKSEHDLFYYFDKYIEDTDVSPARKKQLKSVKNIFKRFIDSRNIKPFYKNCDSHLLKEFDHFLKNEKDNERSSNTAIDKIKKLRTFFTYSVNQGWTSQYPFKEYKLDKEVYGEPIFLTKEERDFLADKKIKNTRLATVRDIFILQCYIGARVGDYVQLNKKNIHNNFLQYIPGKTKKERPTVCRIPLAKKAKEIIAKYKYPAGMLMPFISDQKYNEYLKELFKDKEVKLTREVVRLNPRTRENETVPLDTIVSSHMARRTFIGLLYKTVKNEIIATMSGHVEDSKAFARYYKIDDIILKDAIHSIE